MLLYNWSYIIRRRIFILLMQWKSFLYIFLIAYSIYKYKRHLFKIGSYFYFGLSIFAIFFVRFLLEYTKENQKGFEDSLFFNMGQLLSIPFILIGIILNECPHVPKLAKFKPPRCPIGVYWNTLCLMRDVWTIKTYMI